MEPFDITGNISESLFKLNTLYMYNKRNVLFVKVNVKKTFFLEIGRLLTCNLGIYSQDWQLCSEFMAEFLTNVALRNP